jgi:glycosyltransferase involved in cell wall biosynthesis
VGVARRAAAIGAVARVRANGAPVRLVFMGASSAGGAGAALAAARAAVDAEGLGDAVLFNDTWVQYDERAGWLQAADAVISTHRDHLETRFAFRTRLLDCLWAGVPAVVTSGDELAARIAAEDLGAVARPGDAEGLAAGLARVLERGRDAYAPQLRAAARDYEWPRVVAPLSAFLAGEQATGRRRAPLTGAPARPLRRAAQRLTRLARVARSRRS